MSRSRQIVQCNVPQNWAELFVGLGTAVLRRIRRGAGIEEVSRELHTASDLCQLALAFSVSSDVLKLRALVEDWPLDRIAAELGWRQANTAIAGRGADKASVV